ncbi:hypothetical protein CL614_04790, partial [archaeon]|nr:hypothetical protein [archaeon]
MPNNFDLRILIESENGSQFSYISSSIANSDEDQISSSVFWERITSSVSCSYSNEFIDNGTTGSLTLTTGTNFESDLFLSSSISGSNEDSGSILFTDREPSDDKLKRYKF